ncbi:hypothetical protein Gotur_013515 [Gossypium turneri]
MDSGLSWADQWDTNPDPSPAEPDKKKKKKEEGSTKSKFSKSVLSFKWIKELRSFLSSLGFTLQIISCCCRRWGNNTYARTRIGKIGKTQALVSRTNCTP